jgi:hypothetical protein
MLWRGKQHWLYCLFMAWALAAGALLVAKTAEAGQVGVAAAVKPDAFSEGK